MARWKLTEAHYLKVEGTKWEYSEIDRITGRPKRTQFPVPLYLDPQNLDDLKAYGQTDPELGLQGDPVIIVCNGADPKPRDVVFIGTPTPGMYPLDDEARALTEKYSKGNWAPTTGIDPESQNQSYSNQLMSGLIDQMTELRNSKAEGTAVPGMTEFMQGMQMMMKQQTEILAMLASSKAPPDRRKLV